MFTHRHYVPILKSKRGELWAMGHVPAKSRGYITPLVEVLPPPSAKKSMSAHLENLSESIAEAWAGQRVFTDTGYLGFATAQGANSCRQWHVRATRAGLSAIPVTAMGRSRSFQEVVRDVVATDSHGVMVRLGVDDFTDLKQLREGLSSLLRFLGIKPSSVDLLLDYRAQQSAATLTQLLRLHLGQLPRIDEWRTITMASGSFPSSLSSYSKGDWHMVERCEWQAWLNVLATKPAIPRRPSFGDYGVRDPDPPPSFGTPSVNIRYAHDDRWLVRRGDTVKSGGSDQIHAICRSLTRRSEFCGSGFSEGDRQIIARATTRGSPGGAQQWVQWSANHHMATVVDQLVKYSAP